MAKFGRTRIYAKLNTFVGFVLIIVCDIQLLKMVDGGQAVDIKGVSERSLMKHIKKLFLSLGLKESGDRVFLLTSNARPCLEVVGPLIHAHIEPKEQQNDASVPANEDLEAVDCGQVMDEGNVAGPCPEDATTAPRRR